MIVSTIILKESLAGHVLSKIERQTDKQTDNKKGILLFEEGVLCPGWPASLHPK